MSSGSSLRGSRSVAAVAVALAGLVVSLLLWPEQTARAERPVARLAAIEAVDVIAAPPEGYALVAHRGFPARRVTENTLPAFRRAVRYGATAVELDVQLTRDGRFLVLHDPSLDRTTTCRGRVDRRTLARIQARCRARRGGELLPSLGQALDLLARSRTRVMVDVKRPPSAWTPERYRGLVHAIRSRGLVDRTVVLGFHRANLEALQAVEPALRTQAIADDLAEVERQRTWADGLNLPAGLATPELVTGLRAQGLLVLGRKTSVRTDWARLRTAGADGVLTGSVASYITWQRRVP